ncbi:hypothetical protein D3C87_1995330 [compost metagenome]
MAAGHHPPQPEHTRPKPEALGVYVIGVIMQPDVLASGHGHFNDEIRNRNHIAQLAYGYRHLGFAV